MGPRPNARLAFYHEADLAFIRNRGCSPTLPTTARTPAPFPKKSKTPVLKRINTASGVRLCQEEIRVFSAGATLRCVWNRARSTRERFGGELSGRVSFPGWN